MDTRFLASLLAVIDEGSIAAAARREHLTAAAISQRIRTLENDLGCVLFERSAHRVVPTEACLALLPRARTLLREADLLHVDAQSDGLTGEVRIGAISTALTSIVPALLHEAAGKAPALRLTLVPGSSSHLYELLLSGRLDAAIVVRPPFALPKKIGAVHLRTEPLVFLSKIPVPQSEIAGAILQAPFIRYDPQAWGGQRAQSFLRDRNLSPDVRFDLDALETISLLVSKGLGNALVPLWPGLEQTDIAITPVPDAGDYAREIFFLTALPALRPRAMALLESLAQVVARADHAP